MKLYLVDGYNLIFNSRRLSELLHYDGRRASREEAERVILRWARAAGDVRVLLVYDGKRFSGGHPGNRDEEPLLVRFTDPPAEADDRIVYEAGRAAGRFGRVFVVSDDRGLREAARAAGADTVDIESYLRAIFTPGAEPFKEARFSDEEAAEIAEEQMRRPAPAREEPSPPPPLPARRPAARPKAVPSESAIPAPRPERTGARERYEKRTKRKAASSGKRPSRSRKKRRGF
ncbi:MAG: NYN domain-containing protein [Candidatus Eisenbacteria bacterium]|nr:NYN domain-containing protein [Candidatus Eisenbacteria bacterium]